MVIRSFLFSLFLFYPLILSAQCLNTFKPSCGVYTSCFNNYCNCEGKVDEYSLSFGKAYCNAFLGEDSFTSKGSAWRDSTLVCLQESLVPLIPLNENQSCDCGKLKKFALDTHVGCYTRKNASVCDLPLSDIARIGKSILFNRAFLGIVKDYKSGYSQVEGVFDVCSKTAKSTEARKKWSFYKKLLKGKLK